jgi:hypothetical protein
MEESRERSPRWSDSKIHDVVEVEPLGDHRLRLRFDDGAEGEVDLGKRLRFRGVLAPLKDPMYFAQVRVHPESGTICWPNDVDLDPVVLYCLATGKPIPDWGADAVAERPEDAS